jgi:dephospho-CoA kinase
MKTFGLTGGIGAGKTTTAKILAASGLAVVDTDQIARQLVEPGQSALVEIQKSFGAKTILPDGSLRRDELARIVFDDETARKKLEAILHPRIRESWQAQLAAWRVEGSPAAVVVIPLLFETGAESHFDETVCVACSAATQRERLRTRGWTPEQIEKRLAAQWPLQKKMDLSHHVVWNEGGEAALAGQLARIFLAQFSAPHGSIAG